jgi:hypothetical protein
VSGLARNRNGERGPRVQAPRTRLLSRRWVWWGLTLLPLVLASLIAMAPESLAQDISISLGDDIGVTERAVQIILLITILSLAPSILVMVTSFTRIVVVLSLLAHGHRPADRAAQHGHHFTGAVSDRLHHGANLPGGL